MTTNVNFHTKVGDHFTMPMANGQSHECVVKSVEPRENGASYIVMDTVPNVGQIAGVWTMEEQFKFVRVPKLPSSR